MQGFSGKNILVTGSTRGIGRAVAEMLCAAGATVGVHGRNPDAVRQACAEISNDPARTIPLSADFSVPENAAGIVREFAGKAGRLDGLVNNAGGGNAMAFRGVSLEKWRRTFAVNLEAAVLASREAYILMRQAKAGGIVNIASISAHGPGKWMGADYAASKAGIVSVTKSLAFEAAAFGIRVNAVSPGLIETDMTSAVTPEMRQRLHIPLGRLGRPEEVAATVVYLLSDLSGYVTGQVLHPDGGMWM